MLPFRYLFVLVTLTTAIGADPVRAIPLRLETTIDQTLDFQSAGGSSEFANTEPAELSTLATAGEDILDSFFARGSYVTSLRLKGPITGAWGGSWPDGTSGSGTVTITVGLVTRAPDGSGISIRPEYQSFSVSGSYECEATEGCPAPGDASGSVTIDEEIDVAPVGTSGGGSLALTKIAPDGREVSGVFTGLELNLSNPEHGRVTASINTTATIRNVYESNYSKLFAEFLSDTSSEFGLALGAIDTFLSVKSGASDALVSAQAFVAAGSSLIAGQPCAVDAISAVAKNRLLDRIDRLIDGPSVGASVTAPIGLANDVLGIVANCLANDPPDFNFYETIDPEVLFAGVDLPPANDTPAALLLEQAAERDMKAALALAGALDAFERYQAAVSSADEIAEALQLDNYFQLIEIANQLAGESRAFYADNDLLTLLDAAGFEVVTDPAFAEQVDSLLTAEFVLAQDPGLDTAEVVRLLERFDEVKALLASHGLVDVDLSALYGVFEDYSETDIAVIMENDIGAVYRPLILTDSFESESP